MKSTRIKKIITAVLCLCVSLFCYAKENNKEQFVELDISGEHPFYVAVRKNYGNLWYGYYNAGIVYDGENFVIEKINVYTKQNDKYIFLGCFDKNGVRDKNGNYVYKPPLASEVEVLGYSSKNIIYPLAGIMVVYYKDGDYIAELDPFVMIVIDYENNTLKKIEFVDE